jgi:O-antigen biosynthesis protein
VHYDRLLMAMLEEKNEWISELERSIDVYDLELQEKTRLVHELEHALAQTTGSMAWKLARRLSSVGLRLGPQGTLRRRLLKMGYQVMKALSKLSSRDYVARKVSVLWNHSLDIAIHQTRHRLTTTLSAGLPCFPRFEQVKVSIVVPVYNHLRETRACLESIVRFTSDLSYEVIVVDDCSSDETPASIQRLEGISYLRNERNLGFIGSCNRGAASARGEFLVFLNNDTVVTPGWLSALAGTFGNIPGTGLVGAKLVYPDGRLQEAGGVIWRDASAWNYGHSDNPDHPRYNFVRETDYCSGACIMVPRALFHEMGGFDPHYSPAYYEDVDLAFKVRRAGHKVVFQPGSRVIHHEGVTSGTSVNTGVKTYQALNQPKFRKRWKERLDSHPEPPRDRARIVHSHGREQIPLGQVLIIDHRELTPDRDCGSLRMMEIIRAIRSRGHHVAFVPENLIVTSPYLEALQFIGVEVIYHPYYHSVADYMKQHGREFDLVIISRAVVAARHMTTVKRFATKARIVFDTVDLQFLREQRQAEINQDTSQRSAIASRKEQELKLAMRADLTLVVSPIEEAILKVECPSTEVRIIPTICPVEEADLPGFEDRRDVVFIGGFGHAPNVDAVLYFAREIWPLICACIRDAVFHVIGPDPTEEICQLASPSIRVHGYVPDVRQIFGRCRVAVAPIRYGAGVKGKVNQSMALGVPTVVTSIAAEGMYLEHGHNAMIADDPESFADAVVRLWTSPALWHELSSNGRQNVLHHFSVRTAARRIDELLAWAGLIVDDRNPVVGQSSGAMSQTSQC